MSYLFEHTPNFKDVRDKLARHPEKKYRVRNIPDIKSLAVHHSLTQSGSAEAYARYHVHELGWPGIGYHFVIEQEGTIKYCHAPEVVSYHVGNSNKKAVGICLTGDFRSSEPTRSQWDSLFRLLRNLAEDFSLDTEEIMGHSEFPGYSWKPCPVIDMNYIRSTLSHPLKPQKNPVKVTEEGVFYESRKGDSFWEIANRFAHGEIFELMKQNQGLFPTRLKSGDRIRIK